MALQADELNRVVSLSMSRRQDEVGAFVDILKSGRPTEYSGLY